MVDTIARKRSQSKLAPGSLPRLGSTSAHISWTHDEVDAKLRSIMGDIHRRCAQHGDDGNGNVDYVRGANIGGFIKVADAMLAYGVV